MIYKVTQNFFWGISPLDRNHKHPYKHPELLLNVNEIRMARIVKPLTVTQIDASQPKEKDYNLSDG